MTVPELGAAFDSSDVRGEMTFPELGSTFVSSDVRGEMTVPELGAGFVSSDARGDSTVPEFGATPSLVRGVRTGDFDAGTTSAGATDDGSETLSDEESPAGRTMISVAAMAATAAMAAARSAATCRCAKSDWRA